MKYSRDSRYRIALVSRLEEGQQNELSLFPPPKKRLLYTLSRIYLVPTILAQGTPTAVISLTVINGIV